MPFHISGEYWAARAGRLSSRMNYSEIEIKQMPNGRINFPYGKRNRSAIAVTGARQLIQSSASTDCESRSFLFTEIWLCMGMACVLASIELACPDPTRPDPGRPGPR